VLVRLDATILLTQRDKAVSAKKVLQAEKEAADFTVKQAALEVKRLNDLKRQQGSAAGGLQLVAPIELEKAALALEAAQAHARADPEGKVEFIADQAEADSGLLAVKVRFPNRDLKMRANGVARVRVLTKPGKACWTVPESALMEDQDPPAVVVVEDVEVKTNA